MLDSLAKIYDDGGLLLSVQCTLFEGDPNFVTAILLRFESLSAVFRAVPDDDTLDVTFGSLNSDPEETLIEIATTHPWSACIGSGVRWLWRLTNQQGYSDGVRLEFGNPNEGASRAVVEFVVVASAIQTSVVVASAAAEQRLGADSPVIGL